MKKLMRKKLALLLASQSKKRPYYCEVEFLESTGTQYIDTGIKIDDTCGYDISWMALNSDDRIILGTKGSGDSRWVLSGSNNPYVNISWNTSYGSSGLGLNKIQTARMNYLNDRKRILNNIQVTNISETLSPNASTYNVGIFAGYWGSSTVSLYSTCRIYYAKITKGTETIRDFIPVLDWNMTPCMYDKVTKQVFYNAGTGDFIAGREIHPVEYLESSGTQWINTGIFPTNEMEFESKFTFTSLVSTNLTVIGSRDSTKRCQPIGAYNNKWSASIGGSYDANGSSVSANTSYVVKSIISNGQTITLTVNGNQASVCTSTTGLPNQELYIFGRNFYGNTDPVDSRINAKMYFMKIKAGNVLVRDFIPAIDSSGTPFMFDRVSHTCYLNAGTGVFKYPAREVEYLQSSGTQYINTGYIPNTNTYVELNAMYTSLDSTYRTPFSVRTSDGAANSFTISGATNTSNVYAFGSYYWAEANGCPDASTNVKYFMSLKSGVANFNGVTGNAGTTITPSSLTAYMFARNANGTAANFFIGRIYDCQLKDNGTLVRDFIPCYKDGVACMVDKLTGTAYLNQGTGTFTTGKIVEPEYE